MPDLSLTTVHVAISLIAIALGFPFLASLVEGRENRTVTTAFLATTFLTSATGFLFPFVQVTVAQVFGIISLVVLAIAYAARFRFGLAGGWRIAYIVASVLAFYLNALVGVTQAFQKLPSLTRLAPTGTELPFAIAQLILLAALIAVGWLAIRHRNPGLDSA